MAMKKTTMASEAVLERAVTAEGTAAPKTKVEGTAAPKTPTQQPVDTGDDNIRTYVLEDGNITLHIEDNKTLIAECDLTKIIGPSKSGKSDMISATTGVAGIELPDMPGYCLQLKLYKMKEKITRPSWMKA